VGRQAAEVFAGFADVDPRSVLGAGDVKYHRGATGEFHARSGREIRIHLVSNPSHLEFVNPVVLGRAYAKQTRAGRDGKKQVWPILLHGDGAFAGQGVLAESLNLAELGGYSVGGTIHVVVNNQIAFTTWPRDLQTSAYASDVARRAPIPIFAWHNSPRSFAPSFPATWWWTWWAIAATATAKWTTPPLPSRCSIAASPSGR
jgi:2-oxoglutarate dehydrogenase E1 component